MTVMREERTKKKLKRFLILYLLLWIVFITSYTFSKYIYTTTSGIDGSIAKFKVSVNDVNVKEGVPIQFNFSETSTFVDEKVAPNSTGYFAFTINPAETEVSLEYEFTFDLKELDEDFKLIYFTINDDTTHYSITNGNVVKNELPLLTNERGFTNSDQVTIKVYWSWDETEDIINPDITEYENKNINVTGVIKQKLG